jgi:hypothetical protein
MAGAGAKKFPAFSKLSSDDVNNYLADQVIMRFATTAARDAAFGGVGEPTLAEGMTAYIDDLNVLQTYDGSNWVTTTALQTTSNVSSGLVYITGGALSSTATNFALCFSSTYENYRIEISKFTGNGGFLSYKILNGTTPFASSLYHFALTNRNSAGGSGADVAAAQTYAALGYNFQSTTDGSVGCCFDIFNPFGAGRTFVTSSSMSYFSTTPHFTASVGGSSIDSTNSFDGIQFLNASGGTISGNVKIYGYRN